MIVTKTEIKLKNHQKPNWNQIQLKLFRHFILSNKKTRPFEQLEKNAIRKKLFWYKKLSALKYLTNNNQVSVGYFLLKVGIECGKDGTEHFRL